MNKRNVLGAINGNVDDAAHIGMLNDHLQFNRGVFYHSDAAGAVRSPSEVTIYPQGWHAANAAVIKAVSPSISTGLQTIAAYIITKLFWFLLLIIFFVRSIFVLYDVFSKQVNRPRVITCWLIFASLFFSYFFLLDSFKEGFYSFYPQLVAIPVLAILLTQIKGKADARKISDTPFHKYILPIVVVSIASSLSWLLLLPAFLLVIVLIVFLDTENNGWRNSLKNMWQSVVTFLPLYAIITSAILIQVYLSTIPSSFGESHSFLDTLSLVGPIVTFKDIFYYFVFVGIILCFILFSTKATTYLKAMFTILLPTFIFSACVYILQIFHTNHNEYYYYKVLNTFLILALPIALVGYGLAINKILATKKSPLIGFAITTLLAAGVVQFIGLNHLAAPDGITSVSYLKGVRYPSTLTSKVVWREMKSDITQSNYFNQENVFFYEPGTIINQSYYNTMILKSNKPESLCFNNSLHAFIEHTQDINVILEVVKKSCHNGEKILIITTPENKTLVTASILEGDVSNIVSVKSYQDILEN